jgi:hypothetical protein
MDTDKLLWWGYRHTNGSVQAKRYFDQRDLEDAYESPFVRQVVRPFEANSREDALRAVAERTTA